MERTGENQGGFSCRRENSSTKKSFANTGLGSGFCGGGKELARKRV
jgi:hypothetical protein